MEDSEEYRMIVEKALFELKLMIGNGCIDHRKLERILSGGTITG